MLLKGEGEQERGTGYNSSDYIWVIHFSGGNFVQSIVAGRVHDSHEAVEYSDQGRWRHH